MLPCSKRDDDTKRTTARSGAAVGARIGAAAGSRGGPVTTGIASGFGGAAGFLVGAVIDDVEASVRDPTPLPDGGQPADGGDPQAAADGVSIPVVEESVASESG